MFATRLPDRIPQLPWIDASQTWLFPLVVLGAVVSGLSLVTGREPRLGALGLVVLIGAGSALEVVALGYEHRNHGAALPAAALLAWAVGHRIADDAGAWDAVSGVLGAAYLTSALSKFSASGLAWIDGDALALLMVERTGWTTNAWASVVHFVARQPWLTWPMSAAALAIEISGPLMLRRRFRRGFAAASVLLHTSIGVFIGYWHPEFPLIALACATGTVLRAPASPSVPGTTPA